ncbi:hypothetical protein QT381_15310, partial [Galbitalea sp. SE-J8]|nr:hypothetical protein [Galbitalea sp. SE-J8]
MSSSPPPVAVAVTAPAECAGYRVVRRLATGSLVDVDLGFDPDAGAVALLTVHRRTDAAAFLAAHAALARVRHPHVVRLLDVGATDDRRPVAVLERLEPMTAAAFLGRRGTIGLGEAITLLAPIGQALDACHDAGVAHGGLDASAVLFRADGAPVLASFGAASAAEAVPPAARALDARYARDRAGLAALARLTLGRVAELDAAAVDGAVGAAEGSDRPGAALGDALFALGSASALRF